MRVTRPSSRLVWHGMVDVAASLAALKWVGRPEAHGAEVTRPDVHPSAGQRRVPVRHVQEQAEACQAGANSCQVGLLAALLLLQINRLINSK